MSNTDGSDQSEWKHEAVAELADLARDRVDREKEKASSGVKERAFDAAHTVIDTVEEKLKEKA